MKKFIMMLACVSIGFMMTAAFSDNASTQASVGHACIPPAC